MVIGLGVVLLALGLVLTLGVIEVDISYVDDNALGWILVVAGVLCIVLSLIVNAQRRRHTVIEDRSVEEPRIR